MIAAWLYFRSANKPSLGGAYSSDRARMLSIAALLTKQTDGSYTQECYDDVDYSLVNEDFEVE